LKPIGKMSRNLQPNLAGAGGQSEREAVPGALKEMRAGRDCLKRELLFLAVLPSKVNAESFRPFDCGSRRAWPVGHDVVDGHFEGIITDPLLLLKGAREKWTEAPEVALARESSRQSPFGCRL